jgi:hypothetical protein
MDKKPQPHCIMGHTIPTDGYCDLRNCGDYFPSDGNVCTNLRYVEPSSPKDKSGEQDPYLYCSRDPNTSCPRQGEYDLPCYGCGYYKPQPEPSSPVKCPDCGHDVEEHTGHGFWLRDRPSVYCSCKCTYVEPSPKDKRVCKMCHETLTECFSKCLQCGYDNMTDSCYDEDMQNWKPQPEQMPLICANCGVEDAGICENHECVERQRRDDMAWLPAHDQQVRKDLIEEVCKLLDDELRIISPNTEAKLKAHLRAMAKE